MGELSITGIKTIKIKNKNKITNNKLISINNHVPTTKLNYWLLPRYIHYTIFKILNITFDQVESTMKTSISSDQTPPSGLLHTILIIQNGDAATIVTKNYR